MIMSNNANTVTYAWAIKRLNHYYPGTFNTRRDDYIRTDHYDGKIVALATWGAAQIIIGALSLQRRAYYLEHGEFAPREYAVRRIKMDPARVAMMSETDVCRLLDLDYDLEVAE
jgi:hypothetical protein